jgi:hypothetical protein
MKNINMSNLLVPLLAVLAIYFPLSITLSSSGEHSSAASLPAQVVELLSTPRPTPTPTPATDQSPALGEAARLLCDFFGLKPEKAQDAEGKNGGQEKAQPNDLRDFESEKLKGDYCRIKTIGDLSRTERLALSDYTIEYLIATVPDPIDSRLDHMFDRNLNAIERAIEVSGYAFDRHWLPWDRKQTTAPVVMSGDPKAAQTATRHQREPGVILFRKVKADHLLLLFLVGETPTSGIHKVAFQNALQQIGELAGWSRSDTQKPEKPLRIIGPTFSGSADSLALMLNAWMNEYEAPPEIRIVSGSAIAIDKKVFLEKIFFNGVSFHSMSIREGDARDALIRYLSENDPRIAEAGRTHIAWLTEAETRYGQTIRGGLSEGPKFLSLTFPLHISQLRVEAAKTRPSRNGGATIPEAKDRNVPLPMNEAGSPGSKDIVPLFSPVETVTMELVLDEILNAINRERIRYVGVSATDVQDRIFLVSEIRKHCPNALIFTLSNDLLYLHSDANLDFQGTLVISPYPLFELNQLWTYPFTGGQTRLQFSTQAAQGCYNATLSLLDETERMLEYGAPFEVYEGGERRRPALWISIVGRNGIWPVRAFELEVPDGDDTYTLPVRTAEKGSDPNVAAGLNKRAEPRLGLSGNYFSPMGIGLLLLIGFACLIPPVALIAQLILFRIPYHERQGEAPAPVEKKRRPSRLARAFSGRNRELESGIEEGNGFALLRWISRGWLGQIFGDEEFYRYRPERRIYLMACCLSLLIVALFISGVAILPGWMKKDGISLNAEWDQHWMVRIAAYVILVCTVVVIVWLAASVIVWMIKGARHFRGHLGAVMAFGIGVAMITLVGWGLVELFIRAPLTEQVFFFLRATELTSGVSLLLPTLLIGLATFLSFFAAVRRLNLAERMPCLPEAQQKIGDAPQFLRFDHPGAKSFEGLKSLENRVKEMIVCRIFGVPGAAIGAILILIVYIRLFLWHFIPSVDGRMFDLFFQMAFYLTPLLLVWAFLRFFWLWMATRKLLRRLFWHPLFSHYAATLAEEKQFATLPQIDLMTPTPTYTALSLSVRRARRFYTALSLRPDRAATRERIEQLLKEAESRLSQALLFESKGHWQEAVLNRRQSQAALAEVTEPVTGLLEESWQMPDGKESGAVATAWQNEGKFFLLTHVAAFLQYIFAHLQNLVALVTAGLLLMLLAANSYPFQPREPLLLFSWVTILTAVAVTLIIFVQMSRDRALSLLAGTTPGKLSVTRDLVLRVLIHGALPIVALLGAQFPEVLRQIFSWLSVLQGKGS